MKNTINWLLVFIFIVAIANIALAEKKEVSSKSASSDYGKVNIKPFNFSVQCWTFRKFTFFESLEKIKELGISYVEAYPGQRLSPDLPEDVKFSHDMKSEHIKMVKDKLRDLGLTLVSYGVVRFENNSQSMGQVFNFARTMGIENIVTEPDYDDYSLIEKMVQDYDIKVAIHNHPTPSKYWNPATVANNIQGLDDRIGSCADTGHWLRSGIDPIDALKMLHGRIILLHMKDLNKVGDKKAYDVPFGSGVANIHDILAELTLQGFESYISIEHEREEDAMNPVPPVQKGLDYVKSITYYQDYERILRFDRGKFNKHGWNHYGPGYFTLCEKGGVLKSEGGMGLFWYAARKYKDFILELDYMCAEPTTNSGVFVRVPDMPDSDDYIYHSFEIQIANDEPGIHRTGAIYDAEAPTKDAFNKPGVWNHFKITFKGKHITVELNGQLVTDWDAEPHGKIKDFADEGYIGLQNHDSRSPVYFRNVYIKELR